MDKKHRENPFISFIVAVYNTQCEYLKQCFDSVLQIDACSYELLIVDDGSSDADVLTILEEYKSNNCVKVIHKKNGGVSSARNVGIENATGEYIAFVDSDDYIETCNFEDVVSVVKDNPQISLFSFTHNEIDENGNINFKGNNTGKFFICDNIFNLYQMGIKQQSTFIRESVWAKLYKRSAVIDIKFDEDIKYGEDNLYVLSVYAKCKNTVACSCVFYNYRVNKKSATNKYNPNIKQQRLKNLYKIKELYIKNNYVDQFDNFNEDAIFRTYLHLILRLWIFHKDCPMNFMNKRKKALEVLNEEPFISIKENVKVEKLSQKRKVIFWLLKKKMVFLAYVIYKMKKPLIKKN